MKNDILDCIQSSLELSQVLFAIICHSRQLCNPTKNITPIIAVLLLSGVAYMWPIVSLAPLGKKFTPKMNCPRTYPQLFTLDIKMSFKITMLLTNKHGFACSSVNVAKLSHILVDLVPSFFVGSGLAEVRVPTLRHCFCFLIFMK